MCDLPSWQIREEAALPASHEDSTLYIIAQRVKRYAAACYKMGVTKLEEPNASEATKALGVTWLRAAAHHDGSLAEIHLALGGALEGNASLRHYALAASIAPPETDVALTALHNAGLLLRSLARYEESEAALRRVLKHAASGTPHHVGASNELSLIEIENEDFDPAITRLRRNVIAVDPTHQAGRQNLALALYRKAKMFIRDGQRPQAQAAKKELRAFLTQIADRRGHHGVAPGLGGSRLSGLAHHLELYSVRFYHT